MGWQRELLSPPYFCGQYVQILANGPFAGLGGWVMTHEYRHREDRWYTSVNERCDLTGAWRWFPSLSLSGDTGVWDDGLEQGA